MDTLAAAANRARQGTPSTVTVISSPTSMSISQDTPVFSSTSNVSKSSTSGTREPVLPMSKSDKEPSRGSDPYAVAIGAGVGTFLAMMAWAVLILLAIRRRWKKKDIKKNAAAGSDVDGAAPAHDCERTLREMDSDRQSFELAAEP